MNAPQQIGFHEATVVRFCRYDTNLQLELEDVLVGGRKSRVVLTVSPVLKVMVDAKLSNSPLMEADDGEILTLEMSENTLSLIIEWNDFLHGRSFTKSYQVLGGEVTILIV